MFVWRELCLVVVFAHALGCGGTDRVEVTGTTPSAAREPGPVYAIGTAIFGDDGGRTVYVTLRDSIDVSEVTFDDAREFNGVASFEAIGGRLFVADGEAPRIIRFDITPELRWEEGPALGFDAYPLTDNANFFYQFAADEHHRYLPFDGSKRIIWDPTDFVIKGVMEDSALELERDGLFLEAGGNRNGTDYGGGPVMQPFFYHDEDWYVFGDRSSIAVYDPVTHAETSVIDAPCAGLAVASRDEAGNTYFSSWDYGPTRALYGLGPAPCVVRVRPDRTLDAAWTTDLRSLTGGRYAINFRYLRNGIALADVLHDEEIDADFSTMVIDPDVDDEVWTGGHFHLWRFDLNAGTAAPYDGVDIPGLGWTPSFVDGRAFLFVPHDFGARTRVYELDAQGNASEHLDVAGAASWLRVR